MSESAGASLKMMGANGGVFFTYQAVSASMSGKPNIVVSMRIRMSRWKT
jgi:hypothetical protein